MIVIIGAGVAGIAAAVALKSRGLDCLVLEAEGCIAPLASGNDVISIMPYLTSTSDQKLYSEGFAKVSELAKLVQAERLALGAFQIARTGRLRRLLRSSLPEGIKITDRSLNNTTCTGLLYREAFAVDGPLFLEALADYFELDIRVNHRVVSLKRDERGRWMISAVNDLASAIEDEVAGEITHFAAKTVIFATGAGLHQIEGYDFSSYFQRVKGSSAIISWSDLATSQSALSETLCNKGYLVPLSHSTYALGSSYISSNYDDSFDFSELDLVIAGFSDLLGVAVKPHLIRGFSGIRARSLNLSPIIRQLDANLYLSLGHGSRGYITGFSAGEKIADMIVR